MPEEAPKPNSTVIRAQPNQCETVPLNLYCISGQLRVSAENAKLPAFIRMSLYFHFIVMPVLSVQMAGFPLSTLNPILLEKVIQKVCFNSLFLIIRTFQLDLKSYYRLQQTCPKMMDFILTTPKLSLSIWSNRRYGLEYNRTTCSWECNTYRQWKSIPTTGIYDLRVGRLDTAVSLFSFC